MHAQQNCYSAHLPTPPDAAGDFFTLDDDFRSTTTDFISRPDHQFQQQQQHQLPNHRLNQETAHLLPQMSSCDQSFPSSGDYHNDYLSFNKTPESDAASIDFTHILTMDCESTLDKHAVNHSQGDNRVQHQQQQQQPDYNNMHSFSSSVYSNFPNNFTGGELDSSNGYVVSDGHQGMGNGHNTFYVQNTNGNYAQSFVQSSSSDYSTGHHPVYTMSPSTQQDGNQTHVHMQQHQSQIQMQQRMQPHHHQQQQQHAVQYFRSEDQQQFNHQQHEMMTMSSNGQGSPASRSASTPSSTASLSFSSSSSSSHEPFYDQQHPALTPSSGNNNSSSASNMNSNNNNGNNSSGGMSINAIKRETGEECGTGAAAHHHHPAVVSCKNKSPLLQQQQSRQHQSSHPLCVQTHHLTSHHNQHHEHHNHHNHNHHHRTTNGTLTGSSGSSTSVNNKREKKVGKKRRDPNEPQKPVSAYALFFRDTQATIKGSQPNASFGEVSKIVASMWDSLDPESKANYKKRTEQAKKEYMKALAQYRATLISGSSQQQQPQQQQQSSPSITLSSANNASSMVTGNSPPNHNSNMRTGCPSSNGNAVFLSMQQQHQQRQHPSPLQKRSPLLTSALQANATAPTPLIVQHQHHQQQQQQHSSLLMQQSPVVDSYSQNS